jgi:hypothetical protein
MEWVSSLTASNSLGRPASMHSAHKCAGGLAGVCAGGLAMVCVLVALLVCVLVAASRVIRQSE